MQQVALDGTGFEELGSLPAYHGVIAMHKFEYVLIILGPQEVHTGEPVTLRVGASPQLTGAVAYEWYKDGVLIPAANEAEYRIASASHTDAGEYQLRITDESKGIYLSAPFVLTVVDALSVSGLLTIGLLLGAVLLAGVSRLRTQRM